MKKYIKVLNKDSNYFQDVCEFETFDSPQILKIKYMKIRTLKTDEICQNILSVFILVICQNTRILSVDKIFV